jgi:hypothetical protein
VQIASDEFSATKQLSYKSSILASAEHGLQELTTVRRLTDERTNNCLENIDALEGTLKGGTALGDYAL